VPEATSVVALGRYGEVVAQLEVDLTTARDHMIDVSSRGVGVKTGKVLVVVLHEVEQADGVMAPLQEVQLWVLVKPFKDVCSKATRTWTMLQAAVVVS
jgi:copper(I)-binding protein